MITPRDVQGIADGKMSLNELHEAIYNDFIAINKQDSNFTFWLITQKRQRFNQGGNIKSGYINVGVVKFACCKSKR